MADHLPNREGDRSFVVLFAIFAPDEKDHAAASGKHQQRRPQGNVTTVPCADGTVRGGMRRLRKGGKKRRQKKGQVTVWFLFH